MMSGSKTLNFGVIMKLKKYDIIAIICVAVIVIISYITVNLLRNDEADTVVIYVDGKIEKKLDLNKNQEYKVNVDNGYNIIRIKDKKVRIKESDCSNQTCVNMGTISKDGQTLICLPHKVEVTIVSDDKSEVGLANFAIIIVLYLEGTKEAAVCNFVRILIVGFMFGNLFSIFFALAGATLSMIVMVIMKKTNKFSIMIVSMFGGIFHNIGQIVVASFVVDNYYIFGYLPILILTGAVTGAIIGIVSRLVLDRIDKFYNNKGDIQ